MFELQFWGYHGMRVTLTDTSGHSYTGRMEIHQYVDDTLENEGEFTIWPDSSDKSPATLNRSNIAKIDVLGLKLWKYENLRLRITDIDGVVHSGVGIEFTCGINNPDGIPTFSFAPDGDEDIYIEFEESEIANIEIITADSPVMAKVV